MAPFQGKVHTRGIHIPPSEMYAMYGVVLSDIVELCERRITTRMAIVDHRHENTSGRCWRPVLKERGEFYVSLCHLPRKLVFRNAPPSSQLAQPHRENGRAFDSLTAIRYIHRSGRSQAYAFPPTTTFLRSRDPQKRRLRKSHMPSKWNQFKVAAAGRLVSPGEWNQ